MHKLPEDTKTLEQSQHQQIQQYFQEKYGIVFTPDELIEVHSSLIHLGKALYLNHTPEMEVYE